MLSIFNMSFSKIYNKKITKKIKPDYRSLFPSNHELSPRHFQGTPGNSFEVGSLWFMK